MYVGILQISHEKKKAYFLLSHQLTLWKEEKGFYYLDIS